MAYFSGYTGTSKMKYQAAQEIIINPKPNRLKPAREQQEISVDDVEDDLHFIPVFNDPSGLRNIDFSTAFDNTLPAAQARQEFLAALDKHDVIIVNGPTGTGKSTQFPLFILSHAKDNNLPCHVLVTQPQRIATRAIASRVAQAHLKCRVGAEVGFQIGFQREISERTRLTYCTYGILSRILVAHRSLSSYTHIVLDEIHNRDSETDICTALALILKLQQLKKQRERSSRQKPTERTKIIIMSATLRQSDLQQYFILPRNLTSRLPTVADDAEEADDDDIKIEDSLHAFGLAGENCKNDNFLSDISSELAIPPVIMLGKSEHLITVRYLDDYLRTNHHQRRQGFSSAASGHGIVSYQHLLVETRQRVPAGHTGGLPAAGSFRDWDASHSGGDGGGSHRPDTSASELAAGDSDDLVTEYYDSPWADDEVSVDMAFKYKPELTDAMCQCITSLVFAIDSRMPQGPKPGFTKNSESILIFLPGWEEICRVRDTIEKQSANRKLRCYILHGMLENSKTMKNINRALIDDPEVRRIILSTNIAESSVTIPHAKYVIDSCLTKASAHDSRGAFSLQLKWASQAQCEQRKGRVGRVQAGECWRMVPEEFFHQLPHQLPSVLNNLPLEKIVLQLKQLESPTPVAEIFETFLDPPEKWRIQRALSECKDLGALAPTLMPEEDALAAQLNVLTLHAYSQNVPRGINSQGVTGRRGGVDEGHVTPLGHLISSLPCEPRVSLIIVHAHALGILYEGIMLAAAACEPSIFRNTFGQRVMDVEGSNGTSAAKLQEWEVEARKADRELIQWTADTDSDLIRVFNVLNHWRQLNRCSLGQPLKDTLVFKFIDRSSAGSTKKDQSAEDLAVSMREIMSKKCADYCETAWLDRRRFEALVTTHDELLKRVTAAGFADSRRNGVSVHGSSFHLEWNKRVRERNSDHSGTVQFREHLVKQSNIEAESAELSMLLRFCIAGAYFPHVLVGRSAFSRYVRNNDRGVARYMQPFNWSGTHYNGMNVAQVHIHGDIDEQQNPNTIALERPLMQCIDRIIAPQKINALQFAHECTTSEKLSRGAYSTVFIDLPSARCTMPFKHIIGGASRDGSWSSHGSCSIVDAQATLLSVNIRIALMRLHSTAKPRVNRDMLRIGNTVQRAIREYSAHCAERGFEAGSRMLLRVTELVRADLAASTNNNANKKHDVNLDALVTRKRNCVHTHTKFEVGEQRNVRVTCMRDALNMFVLTREDYMELLARHKFIEDKWSSMLPTHTFDDIIQHQQNKSLFIGTTGLWCVAVNPESKYYERARVLSNVRAVSGGRSTCNAGCSGRHWVLYFVDYGNTAVVCREQVRFVPLTDDAAYSWLTTESKLLAHLLTLSHVRLTSTNWAPQQCHPTAVSRTLYSGGGGIGNSASMVMRKLVQHYSPFGEDVVVSVKHDASGAVVEQITKRLKRSPTTYVNVVEAEPGHIAGELVIKPRPTEIDPNPEEINLNEKMLSEGYFEHSVQRICERPPDHLFGEPEEEGEIADEEDSCDDSFAALNSLGAKRKREQIKRAWDSDKSICKPTLAVDGVVQISQRNLDWPDDIRSTTKIQKAPGMMHATSADAVAFRMENDYEVRKFRVTSPHRVAWHSKHPLFEQHNVVPTRDSVASMHLDPPIASSGWPRETDEVVAISCHVFLTPPRRRFLPWQTAQQSQELNSLEAAAGTRAYSSASRNAWNDNGRTIADGSGLITPNSRSGSMLMSKSALKNGETVAESQFQSTLFRLPLLKASSVTIMPRRTGTLSLLTLLYSPNIYLIANRSDCAATTFAGATAAFHCFTYNSAFGATEARTIDCAFGKYDAVDEALEAERLANEASAKITSDVELSKREEAMRAMRSLMRVPFDSDFTYNELDAINEVRNMFNIVFESVGNRAMLRSPAMRVLQAAIRRRMLQLFAAKRDWRRPAQFEKWEDRAFSDQLVQTWRSAPDKVCPIDVDDADDDAAANAEVAKVMGNAYALNNPQRRRPHFIPIDYPNSVRMHSRVERSFAAPERMWDRVRLIRALQAFVTATGGAEQSFPMAPFFYGEDYENDPLFPVWCNSCRTKLPHAYAVHEHLENALEPFDDVAEANMRPDVRKQRDMFRQEHECLAAALRIYRDELTSVVCPYCAVVQLPKQQQRRADNVMDFELDGQLSNGVVDGSNGRHKSKHLYTTLDVQEHLLEVTKSECARRAHKELVFMEKKFASFVNQHKKMVVGKKREWEDEQVFG